MGIGYVLRYVLFSELMKVQSTIISLLWRSRHKSEVKRVLLLKRRRFLSFNAHLLGENGAKYRTPEMEATLAMELMKIQGQRHQQVQGLPFVPVTDRNMRERLGDD